MSGKSGQIITLEHKEVDVMSQEGWERPWKKLLVMLRKMEDIVGVVRKTFFGMEDVFGWLGKD
eukprot:762982-Hanusia_phi.AAC.2